MSIGATSNNFHFSCVRSVGNIFLFAYESKEEKREEKRKQNSRDA